MTALSAVLVCASGLCLFARAQSLESTESRVRSLYDTGRWTEAAQLAEHATIQSPTLILYQGLALARLNRLAEAASLFHQAHARFPNDKRFPLELAGISYRQNAFSQARKYLHQALRTDSSDKYGNDFLATVYLLDGNVQAALKYWNRISKPLLDRVQFSPPPPLEAPLLERTFDFSAGQIFTLDRFRTTQANLARVGVLADVRFELAPVEGPGTGTDQDNKRFNLVARSVPIEQPLRGWLGRILPMLRGLPYETLNLDFLNIHQRAINFSALARWDSDKQRLALCISAPLASNPRIAYRYFADARDENWDLLGTYRGARAFPALGLRKIESGADFEIGLTGRLQWTLGAGLVFREFRNGDRSRFFSNGWTFELRNRFDYLLWSWPDERLRIDAWGRVRAGRVFTAFASRLVTTEAGLAGTWFPQAKDDKYSVTVRLATGRTFGNAPLDQLFMLGMERDNPLDFWLRGDLGTRNGRKGSGPMGREYALSQTEFKRRLFHFPFVRLDAGPFFDSGWTGDPSGAFGARRWLFDTGLQATVTTIAGIKFRFVYGRDLRNGRGAFYSAVSR